MKLDEWETAAVAIIYTGMREVIPVAIFALLHGISKAILDRSSEDALPWGDFWNKSVSWRRKWKDGNPDKGEAFLGSSTVFVMFTDGWHLAQFFCYTSLCLMAFLSNTWLQVTLGFIGSKVVFEGFYRLLDPRRNKK